MQENNSLIWTNCRECGYSASPDAKYCGNCRALLERNVWREADCCGQHYRLYFNKWRFCIHCGKPLQLFDHNANDSARIGIESEPLTTFLAERG